MYSYLYRFLLFFAMMCTSSAFAQQENNRTDSADFDSLLYYIKHALLFNSYTPQEKVYLHFDNTGYFKGETMYFKAYAIRTDKGQPSKVSKVLYVELLNPSGDVVETRKVKMQDGVGYGDIKLDSIFGTGFYEVRAFTRYMRNWDDNAVFSRVFPIYKAPKVEGDYFSPKIDEFSYVHRLPNGRELADAGTIPATKAKKSAKSYAVTFYPEGGDLVKGLKSRVAISVVNEEGFHEAVKGLLIDPQGKELAFVETGENGRGMFTFTPDMDGTYQLVLTTKDGKRMEFSLPEAKPDGCVMTVDAVSDEISAILTASDHHLGEVMGYTLINRGNVLTYDTLRVVPAMEIDFDRTTIPAGVNQLTIFNSEGRIMADRLFFICPPRSSSDSIFVKCDTPTLSPCSKVKVALKSVPNSSLSFSAIDAATMTDGKVGNALTWMLLSSDVKGYIENPDYYFEADDQEHRSAADLLMMVQGWRRYDWQVHTGVKPFAVKEKKGDYQPIENHLFLHGRLKKDSNKWRKKNPVDGARISAFLYNQQGFSFSGEAKTDSLGKYAFKLPDIEGEYNLVLKTSYKEKDARYMVVIDRHFSPAPRYLSPYETEPLPLPEAFIKAKEEAKESMEKTLDERFEKVDGTYVLPTVKIKKKYWTDNSHLPWYDETTGARRSSVFYNVDDASDAIADEGETLPVLFDWLKSKNSFFSGDDYLRDMQVPDSDHNYALIPIDGDITDNFMNVVFKGGLSYKNRPIVWIVNNTYTTISYYNRGAFSFDPANGIGWTNNPSGATEMPMFIDEVKSVYVSEHEDAYRPFIRVQELEAIHPVTVFVYTHPTFLHKEKGQRRTHFQGFNKPSTFQMEDYTNLPPMEDFRRTLFWAPDIKTDAEGNAHIEFFNNSTCRQIFFSAEGMAPDGHFLISE